MKKRTPKFKKDVHTEHCCAVKGHGCKYGEDDYYCTVATGRKPQSFLCEKCPEDGITSKKILKSVLAGKTPLCPHCGHVLSNTHPLKGVGL
jgi:hypothetical protein